MVVRKRALAAVSLAFLAGILSHRCINKKKQLLKLIKPILSVIDTTGIREHERSVTETRAVSWGFLFTFLKGPQITEV